MGARETVAVEGWAKAEEAEEETEATEREARAMAVDLVEAGTVVRVEEETAGAGKGRGASVEEGWAEVAEMVRAVGGLEAGMEEARGWGVAEARGTMAAGWEPPWSPSHWGWSRTCRCCL